MKVRRCAVLWLESHEAAHFELGELLAGGTGVVSHMRWVAHAPHLPGPVDVTLAEAELLGRLSPLDWTDAGSGDFQDGALLEGLLARQLLVGADGDAQLRATHWHGAAAVYHGVSRWEGVDANRELRELGVATPDGLRNRFGPPPPMQADHGDAGARIPLPRAPGSGFDALLDTRTICRNFDPSHPLPYRQFALLMERVFGARAQVHAADEFDVMKRTSPSGGALHPTEAWLIVQRVEGIAPGLYHYRPLDHALQPMPWRGTEAELNALARLAVAGQDYFAGAHVLVALAPRFVRNFWKYRNHAKAYRVCILDVGHLSQTLLLSAAEQGLGAFVTAAINEVDIERAFGLTGYVDGPLAVCGFGIRADAMSTYELDPNRKVWKK